MSVRFESLDDFIEELQNDADQVDQRVVRYCCKTREDNVALTQVALKAGCFVNRELREVTAYCGRDESGKIDGTDAFATAEQQLKEVCMKLQLELRHGEFVLD